MQETTAVADTATQAVNQVSEQAVTQTTDWWGLLLYCVIIFAIIYFFMVRPNKKRMAEYQKMVDSIQVGNRIMAAGIYGTVKKINEKSIEMEIADGVVIEVNKGAIANVE